MIYCRLAGLSLAEAVEILCATCNLEVELRGRAAIIRVATEAPTQKRAMLPAPPRPRKPEAPKKPTAAAPTSTSRDADIGSSKAFVRRTRTAGRPRPHARPTPLRPRKLPREFLGGTGHGPHGLSPAKSGFKFQDFVPSIGGDSMIGFPNEGLTSRMCSAFILWSTRYH